MVKRAQEMETAYGVLRYEVMTGEGIDVGVMLTEYRGKDIELEITQTMAGAPVTVVGKKAFLGAKSLRRILLPACITDIREWAFASCSNLETVVLPHRKISVGQGIFKDCGSLRRIILAEHQDATAGGCGAGILANAETAEIRDDTAYAESEAVSYLLAAAVNRLDAFYLFDPAAAGSNEWLKQWDARMMALMAQADTDGFSKMLLCGEEDYGSRENDLDYYVEQRRRFKVRLAMLRLMYDIGLSADDREQLSVYLQAHKKGECSEETWRVVLEEHGDEREYYQFLLDHGCINGENFDAMLADMGEKHTEMKAFLMNSRGGWMREGDVFGGLEL
ncbi:MAG: leucine-rich repeat domain-containing protein [Roseburia sp.]|nr:leucine-rich repeat domain-containing protein [Roseburia sp.]MCM1243142.1 leucine-rich repeat domain-containing protein [Roseburia sp.]